MFLKYVHLKKVFTFDTTCLEWLQDNPLECCQITLPFASLSHKTMRK